MLTYLICPSVQYFCIDFRKLEPVSYFRLLHRLLHRGTQLANFSLTVLKNQLLTRGFLLYNKEKVTVLRK